MMTVRHTFPEVKGTCPVNGDTDVYEIIVEFTYDDNAWRDNFWHVETLSNYFYEITKTPISQESLSIQIAREFCGGFDINDQGSVQFDDEPPVTRTTVKIFGNHGDVKTETEITI